MDPNSEARLQQIAFSDASDKLRSTGIDNGFQYYSNQHLTQRIFFDRNKRCSFGGFPSATFFRLQFSHRNCYMVAACIWFSLK